MLCPSRQTPYQKRHANVLKQLNKVGGPNEAEKLLREHRLLGSYLQKTSASESASASAPKWSNDALQALLLKYPAFATQLNAIFPGTFAAGEFIADLSAHLVSQDAYGFVPTDAIPLISVCRDEITRPLVDAVEAIWGNSFSLGSIAGMIFTGTTGLGAGMHHAPDVDDVERFIFIVAPHIAISGAGVVGQVMRPGVPTISTACGSLAGFLGEMTKGTVNFALNTADLEQTLMKGQMSTYFPYAQVPTLQDLTKDAQKLILAQLQAGLAAFPTLKNNAEYAVVSGVQIHGPEGSTFFWPTTYYIVDLAGNVNPQNFSSFGQGNGAAFYDKVKPFAF